MSSDDSDASRSQTSKLDAILKELITFKKYAKSKFEENKETNKKILESVGELKHDIKKLKEENLALKVQLRKTDDKLQFLERQLLESSINIPNIPKIEGEDLHDYFYKVAAKADVKLTTSSIVKIYRKKGKLNKQPGDIIVKCNILATHDLLIKNAKKKKLTLEDIGYNDNLNKLYLNQELTSNNKVIFYEAKQLQKSHQWKYVWESGGFIYIRKTEGSQATRVLSLTQLQKVVNNEL